MGAIRLIGGLLLIFGAAIIFFSYSEILPFWSNSPSEKLHSLWRRDLQSLIAKKHIPVEWKSIREVKLNPVSEKAKQWLDRILVPVKTVSDGKYRLDILVDHWTDEGEFGALIHYQLIELDSGNTVWELARTLEIGKTESKISDAELVPPSTEDPKSIDSPPPAFPETK